MTDFPADILKAAQSITTRISNRMEESSTLGAAATEVIAEGLMAEREGCPIIAENLHALEACIGAIWELHPWGTHEEFEADPSVIAARSAIAAVRREATRKQMDERKSALAGNQMQPIDAMDRLYRAARRLADNIAEFGTVTDGEFINDIDTALAAAIRSGEQP